MSFRDNLQHLRATRNMTQEQLAMLLGVSRQSVTKWEAEKSYPEMDKLLKICQIFDCTLDDLVTGDLTSTPIDPTAAPQIPSGPATDIFGYDEHMRGFAWKIPAGVFLCILGVALSSACEEGLFAFTGGSDSLSAFALFSCIALSLTLFIPAGINHSAFVKAHPYIEDFYTQEQKDAARRYGAVGITAGVCLIFAGISIGAFVDETYPAGELGGTLLLAIVAVGVSMIVHAGMMWGRTNIASYNKEALDDLEVEDIMNAQITEEHRAMLLKSKQSRKRKLTGTVCGIIMLISTAIALTWLFTSPLVSGDAVAREAALEVAETIPFWIPWPIGGICCGIASIAIEGFVKDDEQRKSCS